MWHLGRMAALDFESSDKIPETARIVTCALILVGGGEPTQTATWLLNPGIAMEPEAIKVHGITDECAAEHGIPAKEGVEQIAAAVSKVVADGIPLVGHNLGGYDLNLLNAECQRHQLGTLAEVCGQPLTKVIDTMVLDRHAAPYRRRVSETQGPYQMRTTAQMYGLRWDEDQAHGAEYDALQSARAAYKIGVVAHTAPQDRPEWVQKLRNSRGPYDRFDELAGVSVEELHRRQVGWHATWAADFEQHLRKSDASASVSRGWPLKASA